MERPPTKPHLHFSFNNLRQAARSRIIENIAEIDQRVLDDLDRADALKDQVETRKRTQENIWQLLRQIEEKEEDEQNENEETLPEVEVAKELHAMVLSIERDIADTSRILDQCTKNIRSLDKQLVHNRGQLAQLETQRVSLGSSAHTIQVEADDAKGIEARKLENLEHVNTFIATNQNARATLIDQKAGIETGKRAQQEIAAEKRKLKKTLDARLKIISDLSKDMQSVKASTPALQIAADCLEKFQLCSIHYKSKYHSFDQMRTELTNAKNALRNLQDAYLPKIEVAKDKTILCLLEDLFELKLQQYHIVEGRWVQHDLDLSSFFEGARKPIISNLSEPTLSKS